MGRGGAVSPHAAGDPLSRKDDGLATPNFLRVAGGVGVLLSKDQDSHRPLES